jgi:hypothetical protein
MYSLVRVFCVSVSNNFQCPFWKYPLKRVKLTVKCLYTCTGPNLAGQHSWLQQVTLRMRLCFRYSPATKHFSHCNAAKEAKTTLRHVVNILVQGIQDCSELILSFPITSPSLSKAHCLQCIICVCVYTYECMHINLY